MPDTHSNTTVKTGKGFAQVLSTEKFERVARQSLYDIITFYQELESEMQRLLAEQSKGMAIDTELLDKMFVVKEKYQETMQGFMKLDENSQHHCLIVFADAIQDLMKYIHGRKDS